jgi:hypothetical protein
VILGGGTAPTELFNAVACARVNDELQVLGLTTVGRILQTRRFPDGSWQVFKDVKSKSGDPGRLTQVSCGGVEPATELQELHSSVRDQAFGSTDPWALPPRHHRQIVAILQTSR